MNDQYELNTIVYTYRTTDGEDAKRLMRLSEEATELRSRILKANKYLRSHKDDTLEEQVYHMGCYLEILDHRLREAGAKATVDPDDRAKHVGNILAWMRYNLDRDWLDLKCLDPNLSAADWNKLLESFQKMEHTKYDVPEGEPHAD